ncbi:MAG: SpoIID/LytB domain-containing protein [Solirubrobacterales bacterium]
MSKAASKKRARRPRIPGTNRFTLLAGLLLALACPVPAQAAVSWIVHGRGFGHGVGMSAYGAYGYAKHGKGYRFILGHYYSGTSLETLPGTRVVRVLLGIEGGDVGFSGATSACGERLDPRRSYEAHRSGGAVKLRSSGGKALASCGRRLRAAGPGTVTIAGYGTYRGALETVPTESQAGSLNVVNALAVDAYVKGVIPNESPPSWPMAELRAQAVASRSFALTAGVGGNGFDLYADTRSQVYKGLESEYKTSDEAADATRGQVLSYGGHLAETLFSACSGGHTESIQNVFGGPAIPYLQGVPDPYDYYCPLHEWTLKFSGPEISDKLGAYLNGRLRRVVITKRGASPRIVSAKLYGTGGVSAVSGTDLESALGGYDTWMTFQKVVPSK